MLKKQKMRFFRLNSNCGILSQMLCQWRAFLVFLTVVEFHSQTCQDWLLVEVLDKMMKLLMMKQMMKYPVNTSTSKLVAQVASPMQMEASQSASLIAVKSSREETPKDTWDGHMISQKHDGHQEKCQWREVKITWCLLALMQWKQQKRTKRLKQPKRAKNQQSKSNQSKSSQSKYNHSLNNKRALQSQSLSSKVSKHMIVKPRLSAVITSNGQTVSAVISQWQRL